jgi:hypothetical protein
LRANRATDSYPDTIHFITARETPDGNQVRPG